MDIDDQENVYYRDKKQSEKKCKNEIPSPGVMDYFKKILNLFTIIHYEIKKIDDKLEGPERLQTGQSIPTIHQPSHVQQMSSQMQQQMSSQMQPQMPPMQPQVVLNDNDFPIFIQFLPMNDIESINHFEMLIATNPEAVVQFRRMLTHMGGRSVKENIHRALKKMFTNSCALQCSWKGRKNNIKVSDLGFVQVMKDTFCTGFPGMTEVEFQNIGSEWFRFARQRLIREESKLNRSLSLKYEQNN